MTAGLNLRHEAYLYAQNLDNAGGTEYWRLAASGSICERLESPDLRLCSVRERLDALQSTGRSWRIPGVCLQCRVGRKGDCVLTVRPESLDLGARVSPVLLLFNALSPSRLQAAVALAVIPELMGRKMAPNNYDAEARLKRALKWPAFIIFLHIFFFSREAANV